MFNEKKSEIEAEKRKLEPSHHIYNRILWDSKFDENRFSLELSERFLGSKRIHFHEFEPAGEIPWHRIRRFFMDQKVVWDRENRLDLILGSGETEQVKIEKFLHQLDIFS